MNFVQEVFNALILELGIFGIFPEPVTLKSGRKSHFYANWRDAVGDVWAAVQITNHLRAFIKHLGVEYDCVYGVPEGATKIGVLATVFKALDNGPNGFIRGDFPLPMGRGKPKDHGEPKDRFFVGAPRGKVIVVEDVTTTGGSLLSTLEVLKQMENVEIVCAIGLTNRMETRDDGLSVAAATKKMGVNYFHMSSALELLPLVIEEKKPSPAIVEFIVKEFDEVGVEPLRL
jgi:orotate phosphoribosyltransferase